MERRILEGVARADVAVVAVLRGIPLIALLVAILLLTVLAARHRIRADPHPIDYDAPGADITSEGPDNDFTENYYREAE